MNTDRIALFLPSLGGGGAERVFVQLGNYFANAGLLVDLVLATGDGPYRNEVSDAVNLIDLGASRVAASLPAFLRYLRREEPDVVLSALDHANVIAILAKHFSKSRFASIVSMRSVPTAVYRSDRSWRRWIMLQLIKVLYPRADLVIANSRAVQRDLSEVIGIPEGKLQVIYNPLDIDGIAALSREENHHPWTQPGALPFIIAVGSMGVLKDFPTLVKAFAIVRRSVACRLVILGDGQDRSVLEALVKSFGLDGDVSLPGFVNNPFPWIKAAAVLCSSSLTEGCPNTIMQALACNTPVVSTDSAGGAAEILSNGKWGTLVPTKNPDAMAAALLHALGEGTHISTIKRARDFALDRIGEQYLEVMLARKPAVNLEGRR